MVLYLHIPYSPLESIIVWMPIICIQIFFYSFRLSNYLRHSPIANKHMVIPVYPKAFERNHTVNRNPHSFQNVKIFSLGLSELRQEILPLKILSPFCQSDPGYLLQIKERRYDSGNHKNPNRPLCSASVRKYFVTPTGGQEFCCMLLEDKNNLNSNCEILTCLIFLK